MRVLIATFCDAARARSEQIDIKGAGVRAFLAPSVPATVKTFFATITATDDAEVGIRQIATLRIFDPEKREVGFLEMIVTGKTINRPGLGTQRAQVSPIVLNLPVAGVYSAQVDVAGQVVCSWPFELIVE